MEADGTTTLKLKKSLEPYGQLIKMLLPRAVSIDIFDASGVQRWSSNDLDSLDLQPLVEQARESSPGNEDGLFAQLDDDTPVYLFLLRDEAGALIGVLTVTCRSEGLTPRPWTFVHSLLRPLLECLQRELVAQENIGELSRSLATRDKDLDLLLAITADTSDADDEDDTDELRWIVQRTIEHLNCPFGALVIPEKSIAICRAGPGANAAQSTEVLTRTHRHLLTWARAQGKTLVVNRIASANAPDAMPYKILSCPVRQGANKVVGFFALFRTEDMDDFDHRLTRIARLLARKAATVLQANYDNATGLLTRSAFDRHAPMRLAHANTQQHCIVYLDIDRMHVINENFGMHTGDAIIARIADLARRAPHARAVCARMSGPRIFGYSS